MKPLRVAGLFAGIGGLELGLSQVGYHTVLLCENAPAAQAVLATHFATAPLVGSVEDLRELPDVDVLTAGFPCKSASSSGPKSGIHGPHTRLVEHVFRLLERSDPAWVLLENVPFLLSLKGGDGMAHLTQSLERLGFHWAYRVVEAQAFGLPQRRSRLLILASRRHDPRTVLFADDEPTPSPPPHPTSFGFYWTEGRTGGREASDVVPTIKCGSGLNIASQPAVWVPDTGEIGKLDIRDGERLQGFPVNWTLPGVMAEDGKANVRWRLVGNAVCVPMATWIGARLRQPGPYDARGDKAVKVGARWPQVAYGTAYGTLTTTYGATQHVVMSVPRTMYPVSVPLIPLLDFLRFPLEPLSAKATAGFLSRASRGSLRFDREFLGALKAHLARMQALPAKLLRRP